MSSYAAVTNLCVIFSPYVMSWQVLHRANPLRLGVKSVTSGFYFQNHRNLCRYTSFMSSVLSSPSFSSNRISRLRQFQNHLSTSTPKMSNSNSNFELSSVFNVKGKVSTKPNHFLIWFEGLPLTVTGRLGHGGRKRHWPGKACSYTLNLSWPQEPSWLFGLSIGSSINSGISIFL